MEDFDENVSVFDASLISGLIEMFSSSEKVGCFCFSWSGPISVSHGVLSRKI